jgi:hypothetical protein
MSDAMDIEPLCGTQTASGTSGYRDSGSMGRHDVKT